MGVELLRSLVDLRIPAFAIGGISLDSIPRVLSAGASRVAVSSTVINSPDICETTVAFLKALRG
jgi:thiamine-phosphate pyrophosphorylase